MTKIRADQLGLFLLPEVEQRIRHYTDLANGEVSGLGTVEEFDGGFLVDRVFLPKQTCTPAGTTLDEDAVASLREPPRRQLRARHDCSKEQNAAELQDRPGTPPLLR